MRSRGGAGRIPGAQPTREGITMTSKRGTRRIFSTSLAAGLALLLLPAVAGASTLFNPQPVALPAVGIADPYPSTINVQGLPGKVSNVKVGINGLVHPDV